MNEAIKIRRKNTRPEQERCFSCFSYVKAACQQQLCTVSYDVQDLQKADPLALCLTAPTDASVAFVTSEMADFQTYTF